MPRPTLDHRFAVSWVLAAGLFTVACLALVACTGQTPDAAVSDGEGGEDAKRPSDTNAGDGWPADASHDGSMSSDLPCESERALELYEKRIAPLMAEDRVDSCNKCHFAGVELRQYVRETPCATMACMQQLDVVDLEVPEDSKILSWIRRSEPDSELITDEVVAEEHAAFREWIDYHARCGDDVCGTIADACGEETALVEPEHSAETLLEGCDDAQITQAFADKIYVWNGRCAHCHSTSFDSVPGAGSTLPQWMAPYDHPDAARRTMLNLLSIGAIDTESPAKSNLLMKPLGVHYGGVEHGGGDKFDGIDDPAYNDFLAWLEQYAACRSESSTP